MSAEQIDWRDRAVIYEAQRDRAEAELAQAREQVKALLGVFDDWVVQTEPLSTARKFNTVSAARAFLASGES